MPLSLDKSTVLRLLSDLRRKDPEHRGFGAQEHEYKLNPPIPISVIEEYETQHGITFPEDYSYFMTEIGNGGAGPHGGLFPFNRFDDNIRFSPWEDNGIGNLSQPFPHAEAWNLPGSFWESWSKAEEEHYFGLTIMNGAIPICHTGCNLRQWLVVTGQQTGFVWDDLRADFRGILPVTDESGSHMTFSDWYMSWLTNAIETCRSRNDPE